MKLELSKPSLMVITVAASVVIIGAWLVRLGAPTLNAGTDTNMELIGFPSGQCLMVVVDADGIHLGSLRMPVEQFEQDFDALYKAVYAKQHVSSAIIVGTKNGRYGDAVRVYAKLYRRFGYRLEMPTLPEPDGTRYPEVVDLGRCGWSRALEGFRTE